MAWLLDTVAGVGLAAYRITTTVPHVLSEGVGVIARAPCRIGEAAFRSKDAMALEAKLCAFLSAEVYKPKHKRKSWTLNIDGGKHKLTNIEQNDQTGVWLCAAANGNKFLAIAFTGTQGDTYGSHWVLDTMIVVGIGGLETLRFDDWVEQLAAKHPNIPIIATGHSLGGARSIWASVCSRVQHKVSKAYVFNPGCGPLQQNDVSVTSFTSQIANNTLGVRYLGNLAYLAKDGDTKVVAYHTFGDPLSMLASSSSNVTVYTYSPSYGNIHSINNFVPEGLVKYFE